MNDYFVYDKKNDYANYLNGIISQLKEKGFKFEAGFEILIMSTIPAGGGISSSSALECGFAYAVIDSFDFEVKSLKKDYEVTGIELDTLAETAQKQEGCLGARMTGAGFGGCAIALVHKGNVSSFIENVQKEYTSKIGYSASFFECSSGDGVSRLL